MERHAPASQVDKFCRFHNDYGTVRRNADTLKMNRKAHPETDICKNTFAGRRPGALALPKEGPGQNLQPRMVLQGRSQANLREQGRE
ncbi:UNVERIFIED_CONTAM: hypothetical protein Slati_0129300 [Sesamum latifolium]|uniref:Uncharacterized protein n=1 Tax=Sesamum latifolium TaxID=2727402 RepID=A0AAW2Y9G4_9LAMI